MKLPGKYLVVETYKVKNGVRVFSESGVNKIGRRSIYHSMDLAVLGPLVIKSQTRDKRLKYLLNISKGTCPPGSSCIPPSFPGTGYGWHASPSTLNSPA